MSSAFTLPLIRRHQLDELGWHSRRIRRETQNGYLRLVRPGVYARGADVANLSPEQRIVVRARALAVVALRQPIFCSMTAAAIQGLPCLRDDGRLHVIVSDERAGAPVDVVRHRDVYRDHRSVEIDGLRCTPIARTVADVGRLEPRDVAICVADAALREHAFRAPGHYDTGDADAFREAALLCAGAVVRGRRQAERVLALADGRAQLPGESLSRLRLLDLGFAPPSLQVPVPGPRGTTYWVDFGLDDVGAWGEFDGRTKYHDLAPTGHTPADVLESEKRREDWIRGVTDRRFVRWGWADIRDASTLGRRLAAFGIVPPHLPRSRGR